MSELTNNDVYVENEGNDENSFFNFKFFTKTLLLNWQWFVMSFIIFIGVAALYLRYKSAVYEVSANILIKEDDPYTKRASNSLKNTMNLGFITNSEGFENEMEVLKSLSITEAAIRDLKFYVNYKIEGRVKKNAIYQDDSPVLIDIDQTHLNLIEKKPISIEVERDGNKYIVSGNYYLPSKKDPKQSKHSFSREGALPMSIHTEAGDIKITTQQKNMSTWKDGVSIYAAISNPKNTAIQYAKATSVEPLSKTTTIANIRFRDIIPERAAAFLKQLSIVYNRQANNDKNQIALRTEEFINQRLQKINSELGVTDGQIEKFKRKNNMIDVEANAEMSITNSNDMEKKIAEHSTQIMLLQSIKEYMSMPSNKYQTLPSNVGLDDDAATALISQYNNIVLERNRLMRSASEMSPNVKMLTAQLDDLNASITRAISQAKRNQEIQRSAITQRFNKYSGIMQNTPEQERVLTQIGRQQTVISGLYLMLLEKREENSISLAATADKGKLIDDPEFLGKVAPKTPIILLGASILSIALPFLIFILLELLRFRIEGHADVAALTKRPIIADIAVANDASKGKADIVVKENQNNQMEEIFRTMRTNLQFMMKEGQNIIMFTSSTSGEGKTFTAANLAVSFALLGKKVLVVGLDIRRPRLSTLFELNNKTKGITNLLVRDNLTRADVMNEIMPSGINKNLDLLLAGPVPPNPTEILSRKSLDDIFAILKKEYDYVIIDTAPVGLVADTLQIGRISDITIFVCRADYTEKSAFGLINTIANENKLPNVCIAINGIDMSKKKYGYAYGYGKYGKYGKYGSYAGKYSGYGSYGYGSYSSSHYGNPEDDSIKK